MMRPEKACPHNAAIRAKNDEEFTRRLDAFFSDDVNAKAYADDARAFARLPATWNDERW